MDMIQATNDGSYGECMARPGLILGEVTPMFRCLGRPVCPVLPWAPREIEEIVDNLVLGVLLMEAASAPLVVAAQWPCEAFLLYTLTLVIDRLREHGFSVAICGHVYGAAEPPTVPDSDVALLVGASNYCNLDGWFRPGAGQRIILAAGPEDGNTPSRLPADAVLPSIGTLAMQGKLGPYIEMITEGLLSADETVRRAVICCALGCDLPTCLFPVHRYPSMFAGIQDPCTNESLPWASVVGGHWVAWRTVLTLTATAPEVFASEIQDTIRYLHSLGGMGPETARRLEMRRDLLLHAETS